MAVTLADTGLQIGDRVVPVYSGTVHYWRLERALWPDILDRVKELGFGMIETYIPWSIHEIEPGVFDWGQIDDRKDVEAFISLCEEKGLWLQVRPGPLINAELTYFGFPKWVIDDPDVQARTATGSLHIDSAWGLHPPHQYPVPSYASEAFYRWSAGWFDAICPILARHLAPNGAIVAVQSDNETCYFFHDKAYASDYAPDSIRLYQSMLADKYGTIAALNETYGCRYADFDAVDPPRDCGIESRTDLPLHLDWVAYKEFQIIWAVARFARMLRERGIDSVPIYHDIAFQEATPLDTARMEANPDIDWVGMNAYCNKEQYWTIATRSRFLSGQSRLPYVPEFGCGLWAHHQKTFEPAEHEFITLSAYMNGLRALNFYMLVERERWQGSPITRHATFRPEYATFYHDLARLFETFPLYASKRSSDTVLLFNYDIGRHDSALSTLHLAHVDLLGLPRELGELEIDLGLVGDPHLESDQGNRASWIGTAFATMSRSGRDYDVADTHITPANLARYRTAFVPSIGYMDPADQQTLLAWIAAGGRLIIGPEPPTLDPYLRPTAGIADVLDGSRSASHGAGSIHLASTCDLPDLMDRALDRAMFVPDAGVLQVSVHEINGRKLLYAANPTATTQTDTLTSVSRVRLTPVWGTGEACEGAALAVSLPPYTVRIWEVTDGEATA